MTRTIATVGGIGRVPRLPGTLASLVGAGISWLLSPSPAAQIAGCAAAVALSFWSARPTAVALGAKDPPSIVIDEVAGMMIALLLFPANWRVYLAGFSIFRFLDIFKPLGLRRLERFPGSVGIMLDDLAAGLLTNFLMLAALKFDIRSLFR